MQGIITCEVRALLREIVRQTSLNENLSCCKAFFHAAIRHECGFWIQQP